MHPYKTNVDQQQKGSLDSSIKYKFWILNLVIIYLAFFLHGDALLSSAQNQIICMGFIFMFLVWSSWLSNQKCWPICSTGASDELVEIRGMLELIFWSSEESNIPLVPDQIAFHRWKCLYKLSIKTMIHWPITCIYNMALHKQQSPSECNPSYTKRLL